MQTRATDEAISQSTELQELNRVCTSVDLPSGFVFVSKGGLDDQKLSLSYSYSSDRLFDDSRVIFERYFRERGWKEDDLSYRYPKQLDFTNTEYRIAINYDTSGISNYSVYCERLK